MATQPSLIPSVRRTVRSAVRRLALIGAAALVAIPAVEALAGGTAVAGAGPLAYAAPVLIDHTPVPETTGSRSSWRPRAGARLAGTGYSCGLCSPLISGAREVNSTT